MTSKFTELAIDCADPNGLARFWCSVLDYEVQDQDDAIVTIGSPLVPAGKHHLGPVPPTLTFAHVPEPKTVKTGSTSTSTQPTGSKTKRSVACSTSVLDTPTSAKAIRAGSSLPTQRETSSASLRTAAPDRRPHTAPDLLPVTHPRSREHDKQPSKDEHPDPSKIKLSQPLDP
jgi:Glyoxalase-like domain